jgi:hypothetical protein
MGCVAAGEVPGVDLGLHPVARCQKVAVPGGKVGDQGGEALPEAVGFDAGAGQGTVLEEIGKCLIYLQSVPIRPRHDPPS